jgi:signal transduction histidine kinase
MSWSYSYHSDIWPALITLFLTIYLGLYSWRRRYIPAAKPFTMACILGSFWTLGVILEILAVNYPAKVFWVKFQAIWQLPVGAIMTCFFLEFAGLGRFLNRRNCILLFTIPFISVLAIATNDFHHLIWTEFHMSRHVVWSPGKLHWLFNGYIFFTGLINFTVLVYLAVRSPAHRLPVAIIMAGQIVARVAFTMDKLGIGSMGPGETVFFVIGLVAVACAFAFLRFDAIDPVAAARKVVLDQMSEGVYVLDVQGCIVYANPMAAVISRMPDHDLRQRHFAEVIPVEGRLLNSAENQGVSQIDLILGKDDSIRHYNLLSAPLKGRNNELIGKLLLLRDVTARWQAQNRIMEQQREVAKLQEREHLARELHDGIGQILGYVSMQVQTARTWMRNGNLEKAGVVLDRIGDVARDAHADIRESILTLRTGSEKKKLFVPYLKNYLERFQANFGIETGLSVSPDISDDIFEPAVASQLMRVIQEALTNSRKHSGARRVTVCLKRNEKKAEITVTDDGKGFDSSQYGRHGDSRFGLIFMRERMEQIGGSLAIESIPDGGTVLKLAVPLGPLCDCPQTGERER